MEVVGLDGATVYLPSEQVGPTVGALRRWVAARAGLPSPSLLRLKSGGRNLSSDEAPLAEVDASVTALLRLPGGTHNKYFFSGRMEEARQKPNGGNTTQQFAHPSDPAGPHQHDLLPVVNSVDHHGNPLFNMNPMLIESVRLSDFFWELANFNTFAQLVEQIYYHCEYVTPWVPGTHKAMRATGMQSAVRGVSNAGTPGTAFTYLLKMYYLRLTRTQVTAMINHPDSPFVKAIGFLYLRIGSLAADGFKELWTWFEPHLENKDSFMIDGTPATTTTVGQFCRRLLTDQDYFGDRLPRIPVLVQRAIDANLKERDERGRGGGRGGGIGGGGGEWRGGRDERGGSSSSWRERDAAERKRPAEEADRGAPKQARPDTATIVRAKKAEMVRLDARAQTLRRLIAQKERAGQY